MTRVRWTLADFAIRTLATIRFRAKVLKDFPGGGTPHRAGTRLLRVLDTPCLGHYRIAGERDAAGLRVDHEREDWQPEI